MLGARGVKNSMYLVFNSCTVHLGILIVSYTLIDIERVDQLYWDVLVQMEVRPVWISNSPNNS